jgi:hypothetical protein
MLSQTYEYKAMTAAYIETCYWTHYLPSINISSVNPRVLIGWQTTPASLVCGQLLEAGGLEAQSTSLLSRPSQTTLSRKTPPEP